MSVLPITADKCIRIFFQSIKDYHLHDNIQSPENNPYDENGEYIENLLYKKNWIDTVQWHLEDIIRSPEIEPVEGIKIKRKIDQSNQQRNDTVENIDEWLISVLSPFLTQKKEIARLNSESPAWILDRLSILCLKVFHMQKEIERTDAEESHRQACAAKLEILKEQSSDLANCFDELLNDIIDGNKYMKVYRQLKMYNDPAMNPVLYKNVPKG